MSWKGIAVAVSVVLCPMLWWPSTALTEPTNGSPQPGTSLAAGNPVSTSTSDADKPTAGPSPATTGSNQPAATPTRPSATPDGQAPARPTKDTRVSKSAPFSVDSIEVISKKYRVNAKYAPHLVATKVSSTGAGKVLLQPSASSAVKAMFGAAKRAGYRLTVRSAYRSYASQSAWYRVGDHNLVAPPGASEHQSGLAIDLAWLKGNTLVRGTELGKSKAGTWLKQHAAEFGFIVRYPPGTQRITGISFEPWHFRYVGVEAAKGVAKTKAKTLEEYLGLAQ